jgi:hypothetical protein
LGTLIEELKVVNVVYLLLFYDLSLVDELGDPSCLFRLLLWFRRWDLWVLNLFYLDRLWYQSYIFYNWQRVLIVEHVKLKMVMIVIEVILIFSEIVTALVVVEEA